MTNSEFQGEPGSPVEAARLALQAHYPCAGCKGASGRSEMCQEGQRVYGGYLAALDAARTARLAREQEIAGG